ncbi:DegT/DnrJ/EryC1/StrS family aminotransferase [Singulisphaera sp. Ch08]|uniref:DegT/DnrJ/EryC1/StrS family aminotransferase n=1 Tax=Singulisphaera sp. Ch08 TaxID=3120278 RepID=A0AAU7CMN3_9BACT
MILANDAAKLRVPMSQPSIDEDDIAAVLAVLRTPYLSMGPKVREFEQAMAEYIGVAEGVAVNSGTSGLHLCMEAEGIGPGDEVITTPFSFVASANCVLYQGARPVFADIDPVTLNIDPEAVEARITKQTRAIIAVDVFGQPAAVEALVDIARRHSLTLFQDSCEAIGAERNGVRIGSQGRAAVFAFYPNKQMTTGEGGMVVTDDLDYAKVLRSLCNQGRDESGTWMNHIRLGYNYRLDEMSAALGLSQTRRLDQILDRRERVAMRYTERLRHVEGISTPVVAPETTRMSWFVYVVRLDEKVDRTRLIADLEQDGVTSRPYFVPLHLQPLYRQRFGHQPGEYPVTERIAQSTLALPFFTDMTDTQIDYVCTRLQKRIALTRDRSKVAL